MFLKLMAMVNTRGKDALLKVREEQRSTQEKMLDALADIAQASREIPDNGVLGQRVRTLLERHGGPDELLDQYTALSAYHDNNHLPLLSKFFRTHRAVIFRLLKALPLQSTSQDQSVIAAWQFLLANEQRKGATLPASIPLDFASELWQRTILVTDAHGHLHYDRRHLEVCISMQIAAEFKSADLSVRGSEEPEEVEPDASCPVCARLDPATGPTAKRGAAGGAATRPCGCPCGGGGLGGP